VKIAFPAEGEFIADHFGHCKVFRVFNLDHKEIISQSNIQSPCEHKLGVLPELLHKHGVEIVIVDSIGRKAIDLFDAMGIKVITGAKGLIEESLRCFLNGTLQDSGKVCSHA
jgi:predicted Fe-Mo cluster-binding NifX family protein